MKKLLLMTTVLLLAYGCSTAMPVNATSAKIGSAKGVACMKNVLGFIPLEDDASIFAAARNGNIKRISTVDFKTFITGVYNEYCTEVRGHK